MTKSNEEKAAVIEDGLRQFYGAEFYYHASLHGGVVYTEGVEYLAESAQAYWLIDAIASYYGSDEMRLALASDVRLHSMHFWKLEKIAGDRNQALLTARADSQCGPFIEQHISYTDFPLNEVQIWSGFDGIRWVLYLPGEH